MAIQSIAKGLRDAKAQSGGNWINPGRGVLIVKAMKDGTKPEFFAGDTFVMEAIVEECTPYAGLKNKAGAEKPAGNAIGSTVSFVCTPGGSDYPETEFNKIRGCVCAVFDETEESLIATGNEMKKDGDTVFLELYEQAVDRKLNPAAGQRVRYDTSEKETRNGELITRIHFTAYGNTAESVADGRKKLGLK